MNANPKRASKKKGKKKAKKAGEADIPEYPPGDHPSSTPSEASMPSIVQDGEKKPTISLYAVLDGVFEGGGMEHRLGGEDRTVMLEFWRDLPADGRLEYAHITRDEVFSALDELQLTTRFRVEGEPREEVAAEVVKAFLWALEANDGNLVFRDMPSLEEVATVTALENKLLVAMERSSVRHHALFSWLLLWWQVERFWCIGYIATGVVSLVSIPFTCAIRDGVSLALEEGFIAPNPWAARVRHKSSTTLVTAVSIGLVRSTRMYILVVTIGVAAQVLEWIVDRTTNIDDKASLGALQRGLLWVQKAMLLLLAASSYVNFFACAFYYFPTLLIVSATASYAGVGMAMGVTKSVAWRIVSKYVLLPRWKYKLERWWEGPMRRYRLYVMAAVAVVLPLWCFGHTAMWLSAWKRAVVRWLAVFGSSHLLTLDDGQWLWRDAKHYSGVAVEMFVRFRQFVCMKWSAYSGAGKSKEWRYDGDPHFYGHTTAESKAEPCGEGRRR